MNNQRRQVLTGSAATSAAAAIGLPGSSLANGNEKRAATGVDVEIDVHIELHAIRDKIAIRPGERYVCEFTVMDRAGSYWSHPHPHGQRGQAGLLRPGGPVLGLPHYLVKA